MAKLLVSNCLEERVWGLTINFKTWFEAEGSRDCPWEPWPWPAPAMVLAGMLWGEGGWLINRASVCKRKADAKNLCVGRFTRRMMPLEFLCPCHSLQESLWHKVFVYLHVHMCVCTRFCVYFPAPPYLCNSDIAHSDLM